MVDTPRLPLFVPRREPPRRNDEKLSFGSPATLTTVYRPRFQPFQFWPEPRPPRSWDEKTTAELGTSTALVSIVFKPRFQPFQFWPEAKPPRRWQERDEFRFGSPSTLTKDNPKFHQPFVQFPEVRLPVVPHQPAAQGSAYPLLHDKPIGKQTPFQPELITPTRLLDKGQLQQGSPHTLTGVIGSEGAGSASGTGTATGVGNAINLTVGSASGIGSATGVGNAVKPVVGNAAGTGAATGVGSGVAPTVGSAAGTGTATAVGQTFAGSVASASGTGTATGIGQATDGATGSANGIGTATGIGLTLATAVGNAAGIGTATAISASFAGAGTASGTGTASGVGQCIKGAVGNASGTGTAVGVCVDAALVVPDQPTQPTSSGIGPPPRRRPIIDIVIQGIILTCYTRILSGRATGISLIPGVPKTSVVAIPNVRDYNVRIKFIDPGFPICDEITDEDLISILDRILI